MVSRLGFSFPSHSCNLYIPKFGDERICLCPSNTTCAHEATIISRDRGLSQARITTQLLSIARQGVFAQMSETREWSAPMCYHIFARVRNQGSVVCCA